MSNSLRESDEYLEDSFNEPESWAPELQQYEMSRNGGWARRWAPGCNNYASQESDQLEFDVSGRGCMRAWSQGVNSRGGRVSSQGLHGRWQSPYVARSTLDPGTGPRGERRDFLQSEAAIPPAQAASPNALGDVDNAQGQHGQVARNPRSRKRTGTWSDETLAAAIAAVDAGGKLRTVGRDFGIPASSLRDHVYGTVRQRKRGRAGVLTAKEESDLVTWMLSMQDHAHPISVQELRIKVAEITQERWTPFTEGIPGRGWMRWFRRRHPELTLRAAQGLEEGRARGLNSVSVASFYENLRQVYEKHQYSPSQIWNADESGAQAGRNGGGTLVFARRGSRSVHTTVPDNREHITVLSCVNAAGAYIPNFYIFKGKRRQRNYIIRCEPKACMAMQPNAWMTAFLFSAWISHFISIVKERYGISMQNRHLLVLDGHGSHVTLEVVQKAREQGLDILTLPSHTSHRLQPLDVSIFKPFKVAFRACRDRWTINNKGKGASKEDLADWVSQGLRKALTIDKIQKGFAATGIWPLNPNAMDKYMQPSSCFEEAAGSDFEGASDSASDCDLDAVTAGHGPGPAEGENGEGGPAQEDQFRDPHFFVASDPDLGSDGDGHAAQDSEEDIGSAATARNLFALPQIVRRTPRARRMEEPLVDYSKSIIMTSQDYIDAMEAKAARKLAVAKEREERKIQAEARKLQREEEKTRKEAEKVMRSIQAERRKVEREREKARKSAERARKKAEAEALKRQRRSGGFMAGGSSAAQHADQAQSLRQEPLSSARDSQASNGLHV